jgi:hypothetical protein
VRAAWLVGLCVVGAAMPIYIIHGAGGPGADHRALWEAGRSAHPYSTLFSYPPVILPLFWPFGLLPVRLSYWLFNAVSLASFVWAARPFARQWWVAALPGVAMCLAYGQTGLIVGALWLLAFRHAPAVALLSIKPHMGVLAVANLRSRRDWAMAIPILVLLCAIPMFAYGPSIWAEWLNRSRSFAEIAASWDGWHYISVSPTTQWGFWPWLIAASTAAFLLVRKFDVFTAATAALIISPYAFIYDTPVASLGIALALLEERSWLKSAVLSAALLSPSLIMFGAAWVPAALLAALWIQTRSTNKAL